MGALHRSPHPAAAAAGERGLTLVEALVGVGIVVILAAIALPHFGFTRTNAYNAIAVSALKDLAAAESRKYSVDGSFVACSSAADCVGRLAGLRVADGIQVSAAVSESPQGFVALASHVRGDQVYRWNSLLGGLQEGDGTGGSTPPGDDGGAGAGDPDDPGPGEGSGGPGPVADGGNPDPGLDGGGGPEPGNGDGGNGDGAGDGGGKDGKGGKGGKGGGKNGKGGGKDGKGGGKDGKGGGKNGKGDGRGNGGNGKGNGGGNGSSNEGNGDDGRGEKGNKGGGQPNKGKG